MEPTHSVGARIAVVAVAYAYRAETQPFLLSSGLVFAPCMLESPRISIVIPVHNEQDDVAELAKRLKQTLVGSYEIIFIDDGSTDDTWHRLVALHEPGLVRLVRFRRNFGKTAALLAGFSLTRGELVLTMDGDLQDDPHEIPRFLEQLEQGCDLVTGWKRKRHDPEHKVARVAVVQRAWCA